MHGAYLCATVERIPRNKHHGPKPISIVATLISMMTCGGQIFRSLYRSDRHRFENDPVTRPQGAEARVGGRSPPYNGALCAMQRIKATRSGSARNRAHGGNEQTSLDGKSGRKWQCFGHFSAT
jgi:hypothetical protein